MKRADQLQPLSREHHLGLVIGRHAKECEDTPEQILKHWTALTDYIHKDMTHHFGIEDDILIKAMMPYKDKEPKVGAVLDKLEAQHQELEQLTALNDNQTTPTVDQVHKLANALYDHIRFEERELFPLAQTHLSEAELAAIYDASADNVKRADEGR